MMNVQPTRAIRICMATLGFAIGSILLAQKLGAHIPGCGDSCAGTQRQWFSPILIGAVILLSLVDLILVVRDDLEQYDTLVRFQGGCAIVAAVALVANHAFCPFCVSAQMLWCAMALESFQRRPAKIIGYVIAGFALILALNSPSLSYQGSPPPVFSARPYEGRLKGSPAAFVIFTDPLSPNCRDDENRLQQSQVPVPIIHRWRLLPQHGDDAIKIAAFIESGNTENYEKGKQMQTAIYKGPLPPSRIELIAYAKAAGFDGDDAASWLGHPDPQSLRAIKQDGDLSDSLDIKQVPCLCEVDTVFAFASPSRVHLLRPLDLDNLAIMTKKDFSALRIFYR